MPTDEERREVARKIREAGRLDYYSTIYRIVMGGDAPIEISRRQEEEGLANRLADLIEPPTQCPYYRSDRHYCSIHDVPAIDCDALLELADEMDERAPYGWYSGERDSLRDYARRIREACGVEP